MQDRIDELESEEAALVRAYLSRDACECPVCRATVKKRKATTKSKTRRSD